MILSQRVTELSLSCHLTPLQCQLRCWADKGPGWTRDRQVCDPCTGWTSQASPVKSTVRLSTDVRGGPPPLQCASESCVTGISNPQGPNTLFIVLRLSCTRHLTFAVSGLLAVHYQAPTQLVFGHVDRSKTQLLHTYRQSQCLHCMPVQYILRTQAPKGRVHSQCVYKQPGAAAITIHVSSTGSLLSWALDAQQLPSHSSTFLATEDGQSFNSNQCVMHSTVKLTKSGLNRGTPGVCSCR